MSKCVFRLIKNKSSTYLFIHYIDDKSGANKITKLNNQIIL